MLVSQGCVILSVVGQSGSALSTDMARGRYSRSERQSISRLSKPGGDEGRWISLDRKIRFIQSQVIMLPPPILAHGPALEALIVVGLLWVLFAYGSPALVRWLTKRQRKILAIIVGVPSLALTGFITVFFLMESESIAFTLLLGAIPSLLLIITLAQAFRLRSSAAVQPSSGSGKK